ncbi:hypothetical protein CCP1ISM_20018 [Azospirillaceae bacterium]
MNDTPLKREDLVVDLSICRIPYGKRCYVIKLDDDKKKALVKTGGYATWVNYSTLFSSWRIANPIDYTKIIVSTNDKKIIDSITQK